MQRDFGWITELPKPRHLTEWELNQVNSEHEAFVFMIEHRPRSFRFQKDLAEALGISKSHFSMMKNAPDKPEEECRHWPMNNDFIDRFQYLTGLYAFDDYREKKRFELEAEFKLREAS